MALVKRHNAFRKKLYMKPSEKQFFENAIHNQDEYTKLRLAEENIFLEILLNDESSYVREAVARQKYRIDVLMYDNDEDDSSCPRIMT